MSIVWFARGGGILRCGPFTSQIKAVKAMRLGPPRRDQVWCVDPNIPRYPPNMFVWPEEQKK